MYSFLFFFFCIVVALYFFFFLIAGYFGVQLTNTAHVERKSTGMIWKVMALVPISMFAHSGA